MVRVLDAGSTTASTDCAQVAQPKARMATRSSNDLQSLERTGVLLREWLARKSGFRAVLGKLPRSGNALSTEKIFKITSDRKFLHVTGPRPFLDKLKRRSYTL